MSPHPHPDPIVKQPAFAGASARQARLRFASASQCKRFGGESSPSEEGGESVGQSRKQKTPGSSPGAEVQEERRALRKGPSATGAYAGMRSSASVGSRST